MSDGTDRPQIFPAWPAAMSVQPVLLGVLGLGAGVFAILMSGEPSAFVLSAISGGCLGAAALLAGYGILSSRRKARALKEVIARITHDPASCVVTDQTGRILGLNQAATVQLAAHGDEHLSVALGHLLPNAGTLISRQLAAVREKDGAHETVRTARGPLRLHAAKIAGGILWRLDDLRDTGDVGQGIGLPMMVVTHADVVLSANDAMAELLSAPATTLSDVFPDQPLVPGRRTRMHTKDATIEVVPIILSAPNGTREVYAVPGLAEPPAASVAARAFESLPVASLHIAADGQILASNRQAQVLLGIGPEDEGPLSALVEGLGRPVKEWVADTAAERTAPRSEVVRARRRSDECFLQIALSRITDATGPSLLAVLHDATELKKMEQQFVQSQKMQAVGELAGGVAHDFNNLLTAITGHCDLLLLRHDQGDPDYSDLVQISQNANRAASLVGQLLAFSRQQKLKLEIVDLRDTMAELMHLLNRLVGEKITMTLDHDPALLPIRVDRRQLDQVVMNLVVNARDAMADGGEIRVETRVVRLSEALHRDSAVVPAGNYVTITVRDEGHGIPASKLGRIFEPFFTTKDVGKGTGLGLSMAYGIIKQSGGYIFVDSTVGVGSNFTIYIPVYDAPAQSALTVAEPDPSDAPASKRAADTATSPRSEGGLPLPVPPQDRPATVLLVEDEAPVRAFASRALKLRGYKVVEAGDAETALATLSKGETDFDLFITDVVMPGMDGPSWVRQAMRDHPDIKVVFVSGYSEDDIGELSDGIPNAVFLPKPFSLSDLTATVARQLS